MHTWQTGCRKGVNFMKILISNSSDQPLYMQIKEQLKDAILREELKDGDSMPSIRRFANDLGVSVLTVRRVYDELEAEGYLKQQVASAHLFLRQIWSCSGMPNVIWWN